MAGPERERSIKKSKPPVSAIDRLAQARDKLEKNEQNVTRLLRRRRELQESIEESVAADARGEAAYNVEDRRDDRRRRRELADEIEAEVNEQGGLNAAIDQLRSEASIEMVGESVARIRAINTGVLSRYREVETLFNRLLLLCETIREGAQSQARELESIKESRAKLEAAGFDVSQIPGPWDASTQYAVEMDRFEKLAGPLEQIGCGMTGSDDPALPRDIMAHEGCLGLIDPVGMGSAGAEEKVKDGEVDEETGSLGERASSLAEGAEEQEEDTKDVERKPGGEEDDSGGPTAVETDVWASSSGPPRRRREA